MAVPHSHLHKRADSPDIGFCILVAEKSVPVQTKCGMLLLDLETDDNGVSPMVLDFFTLALDSIK
jgi:hypothetical protein